METTYSELPFDKTGLGEYKVSHDNSDEEFNFLHLLWIIVPFLGWFVLIIVLVKYFWRAYPRKAFHLFELGYVYQKGSSYTIYKYAELDSVDLRVIRRYTNGIYTGSSYTLYVYSKMNGRTTYTTALRNEDDEPEKYDYLATVFHVMAVDFCKQKVAQANVSLAMNDYAVLDENPEIRIYNGRIVGPDGFVYTNVCKAILGDDDVRIQALDYKSKMFGHEGHELKLSLRTNRMYKMLLMNQLMSWSWRRQ